MIIIMWIVFSFIVGAIGSNKSVGFIGGFFLSLLLSPLIGLIIVLVSSDSDSKKLEELRRDERLRKQVQNENKQWK